MLVSEVRKFCRQPWQIASAMGLKTVKWLTISQFELREGRALRQTPLRRLQVLVSEHALRQTKLTPESHHRIACVTVRSEKQRRYPCSGPQPTQ